MDFTCVLAAIFVFTGNLLLAIWAGIEKSRPTFEWNLYKALDPTFLQAHWWDRRDLSGLHFAGSFIVAISWVILTIPILQAAFVLSNGGRRQLWVHTMMGVLAISAATTEFVSRLMHVGAWNTGNWISRDFDLEHWGTDDMTPNPNGIGWKSLEISYQLTAGMILWVDGWEYFALFGLLTCNFISIRTAPHRGSILGDEMCWGGMGLFIGMLSLANFVFLVIRFVNWDTFNMVSIIMTVLIRLILLPTWLLLLAFKLPPAVKEFAEKRVSSLTTPLTGNKSSDEVVTPPTPGPGDFTIED